MPQPPAVTDASLLSPRIEVLGSYGTFPSFEAAAEFAVQRFADREFLIRHTDSKPAQVPFIVVEN